MNMRFKPQQSQGALGKMRRHSGHGFTLIELMVVVSIIGVLASVALPSINGAATRARAAEITIVRVGIERATKDAHMRNNFQWPVDTGFNPDWNPTWDPSSVSPDNCYILPAAWDTSSAQDAWKWIDFVPEGQLRGRYSVHGMGSGTVSDPHWFHTHNASDMNRNGICSARVVNFTMSNTNNGWVMDGDLTFGVGSAVLDPWEI